MPLAWPFMGFADAEGGMLLCTALEAPTGQTQPSAQWDVLIVTPLESYTRGGRRRLYRSAPSH